MSDIEDVQSFRLRAREWISANLPQLPEQSDVPDGEGRGHVAFSHEALIRRVAKPGGTLPPSALPSTTFRVRETEVLIRDDGAGNPVWKIWI